MTASATIESTVSTRKTAALALLLVGMLSVLAGLFLGLQGFRASEHFGMSDLKRVQDNMYLYRIDLKPWPEPPFLIIDDARHGTKGTLTELTTDGQPVTTGRASRPDLLSADQAAYLHTGVGNIYISPGPSVTDQSRFTVTFSVRLDPALWISLVVFSVLVGLAGLALLGRQGLFYDLILCGLLLTLVTATWLHIAGLNREHGLAVTEIRKLEPHGYLARLPRLGPLIIPATDRALPDVNGRLLEDGEPIGMPLALSPEIIKQGNGAHLMAARGAFYFSLPGNIAPDGAGDRYAVRVTYVLPQQILLMAAAALALVLIAGLAGGNSHLLAAARRFRPALTAIAIPLSIAATALGYLAWLFSVDALHMRNPPSDRDWFTANEGWRMAGLVRTYPYEGLIVGTSVSQNFYMAEASGRLGLRMLNATMAGSTPTEQAALARLALVRDSTDLVMWEIHMTSFTQPVDAMRPKYFPMHLFDGNPLTDLEYHFSLQAWLDARGAVHARDGERLQSLDPINKWGERMDFGPEVVAKTYCKRRGKPHSRVSLQALEDNLRAHVLPLVQANPDRRFVLFVPAYPVLMHMPDGGRIAGLDRASRIIMGVLGDQTNVAVHDFQGIGPEIGDARLYRDDMHYHPSLNSRILEWLADGRGRVLPKDLDAHEHELKTLFATAGSRFAGTMASVCGGLKK